MGKRVPCFAYTKLFNTYDACCTLYLYHHPYRGLSSRPLLEVAEISSHCLPAGYPQSFAFYSKWLFDFLFLIYFCMYFWLYRRFVSSYSILPYPLPYCFLRMVFAFYLITYFYMFLYPSTLKSNKNRTLPCRRGEYVSLLSDRMPCH